MAEFDLIEDYFKFSPTQSITDGLIKGIGDDCAILETPNHKQLVTSVDTLVSGVHFFADANPADIAYKALAVNISDILAMGAQPKWFTLAIAMPEIDHSWLAEFSQSLKQTCQQFGVQLIGGDTTQGPLTISISAFGLVEKGQALTRSGAKAGDDIWVTGTLGSAAYALQLHDKANQNKLSDDEAQIWQSLIRPQLPYDLAQGLQGLANSTIDLSDGLKADLGHILKQSNCGAELQLMSLPIAESLTEQVGLEAAREYALSGGDDYQLCFTASQDKRLQLMTLGENTNCQLTRIGTINEQNLTILLGDSPYQSSRKSWQHFSSEPESS